MNCPRCKADFESSERLLQHFVDSPACFLHTVSLAGADGGTGNQPLAPSAVNPQKCQTAPCVVMSRRSLLLAGTIVVAVSMAMSAVVAVAVTAWIRSHAEPKMPAASHVAVQPAPPPNIMQAASVSNAAATLVSPAPQVLTSALPASVATASTGLVTAGQNAAPDSNITLRVSASRPSIHLGESFSLTIEVSGADRGVDMPDFSALPQSDVLFLGQHSNSRSSITIINGRMTRETFEGRVFSYKLTPKSQGEYHTGPVRVIVSGKTYTHPGVTVEVIRDSGTVVGK